MIVLTINASAAVWSPATSTDTPLVVLLHGYGSHEHDLVSLGPYLPKGLRTVALRAPLIEGPGYAWVPLEIPSRPNAQATQDAAEAVLTWLDAEVPETTPVILLGFSQGGLMVTQLMRNRPHRFLAGVVLSGFVAETVLPTDAELAEVAPPVFFGRGDQDPVITREAFDRLHDWLAAHCTTTEVVYPGLPHGINEQELRDIYDFTEKVLKTR